jgi:hypothetical protein
MFNLKPKKTSNFKPEKIVCNAHKQSLEMIGGGDSSAYVRKDVFGEYARRMDERCGNHEQAIINVGKKVDKTNSLLVGLLISLLLTGLGFVLNVLKGVL